MQAALKSIGLSMYSSNTGTLFLKSQAASDQKDVHVLLQHLSRHLLLSVTFGGFVAPSPRLCL